jgi:uncharacterized membrane protein YccC
MVTVTLHDVVVLFVSRDFWVNFLGNLGGALVGVWLAFWIERRRSRRDADRLYGHMLVSARSELAYLRPMCVSIRDRLKAGGNATRESFRVPATMAVLISPMTHERGPYSLVMALTATTTYAESTADGFREATRTSEPLLSKRDQPAVESAFNVLRRSLQSSVDKLQEIIGIAIESMDVEIARLGVKTEPDAATQVVSERLRDILGRTE